jgi:hypothetical protein
MDPRDKARYEKTPENEAAEEAAFEAACNGTDPEPAPEAEAASAEATAADELQHQQEQQAAEQQQAEPAPAAAAAPAKEPTVAELLEQLGAERTERQKLNDKVFGKVGELQQKIDAMKTTAHGISPKARERLKTDFPELAEMLFEDVAPVEQQQAAPSAVETEPVQTVQPAAGDEFTTEQRIELRLLKRDHPDYEQVAKSPEFATWTSSVLSPDDAAALNDAWDADLVSKRMTEFKAWKAGEAKAAADKQTKQDRLGDAINPRGIPRVSASSGGDDDEEAAMLAAYGKNKR